MVEHYQDRIFLLSHSPNVHAHECHLTQDLGYTVLLRDNIAKAHNLFRVTSLFILIESASGMRISLDYQPIEVNADVATESYATECNCKDKATRIWNFIFMFHNNTMVSYFSDTTQN